MSRLALVLAVLGAAAIAGGAGWVWPPGGVITAGVELVAAAYLVAYLGKGAR